MDRDLSRQNRPGSSQTRSLRLSWMSLFSFFAAFASAAEITQTETVADIQTTVAEREVIETFKPPETLKLKHPKYPKDSQRRGYEGWVYVSMMVDPTGKPYDETVQNSSGDSSFEKAALRAVRGWRFKPAELGATKIDAAVRHAITFELSGPGGKGAAPSYVRRYRRLMKAIESDEQEKAEELLADLEPRSLTLYEQAYFQVARYQYEKKWGSPEGQYIALGRATFLDRDRGFLPDETLTSFLAIRMNLELQMSRFSSARKTAAKLPKREISDALRSELEKMRSEIDQYEASPGTIVVSGRIDNSNYFSHSLLRPTFSFRNVKGDIAELRLHCDKGYVGFIYKPEISYTVEPGYRDCGLTAIGTPGSTFELIELPAAE